MMKMMMGLGIQNGCDGLNNKIVGKRCWQVPGVDKVSMDMTRKTDWQALVVVGVASCQLDTNGRAVEEDKRTHNNTGCNKKGTGQNYNTEKNNC